MFSVATVSLFGFEFGFDLVLSYLARILDKLMVLFGLTTVRHCCHVSQMNKCVCFIIHFHASALCVWPQKAVHVCPHHLASNKRKAILPLFLQMATHRSFNVCCRR